LQTGGSWLMNCKEIAGQKFTHFFSLAIPLSLSLQKKKKFIQQLLTEKICEYFIIIKKHCFTLYSQKQIT